MSNYIKSVQVNILNGVLAGSIDFEPGLNIISGENGTLKTKLLQTIKAGQAGTAGFPLGVPGGTASLTQITPGAPTLPLRTLAISPKRNAERRNIEAVIHFFRQNNRTLDTILNERAGAQINDQTFEAYPSAGELYYALYEKRCRDGGNQREKMAEVTSDFNYVIKSVFNEYALGSEWDEITGTPRISLMKRGTNAVPIEALSLGEQEILSLVLNLYTSKDSYEVFLIDEPEIHLNWHLEERLFEYLEQFCSAYEKQIIVVTHSRAIFKERFLKKTQFFYWTEENKIAWGDELTEEQRRRIAGEAIDIIRLGDFSKPTFFVEDNSHRQVIEAVARVLGTQVPVSECGNSANVKSLFKLSKSDRGWKDAFFLVDGDNEGNPFPGEPQFIHLDKYCIENYLIDFDTAARITGKTEREIQQVIFDSIVENRNLILKKNKYFDFLFDRIRVDDITQPRLDTLDASVMFESYLRKLGMSFTNYVHMYTTLCNSEGKLSSIFPQRLIEAIERAKTLSAGVATTTS